MKVNVKYFGQVAEKTNVEEETWELAAPDLSQLLRRLKDKYVFSDIPLNIAVNHKLVAINDSITLTESDEIAILPPFAGG
ncbi:MAG: MoaD/ThiS family protein [Leeuwenhoekiella sp.]